MTKVPALSTLRMYTGTLVRLPVVGSMVMEPVWPANFFVFSSAVRTGPLYSAPALVIAANSTLAES